MPLLADAILIEPTGLIALVATAVASLGGGFIWFSRYLDAVSARQHAQDLELVSRLDAIVDKIHISFSESFRELHDKLDEKSCRCNAK